MKHHALAFLAAALVAVCSMAACAQPGSADPSTHTVTMEGSKFSPAFDVSTF